MATAMDRREVVEELIRLVEEDQELAERLRRALLSRELLGLPEHVAALAGAMRDLADTQRAVLESVRSVSQAVTAVTSGLRTLMRGQERLLDVTTSLQADVAALKQDVAALKEGQARLEQDVAALKQDVAALKEGQARLEQDVAALKQDVAALKEGQARLKQDVAALKQDVAALKEGQARLEQDVAALKEGQARLERRLDRLERQVDDLRGDVLEQRYRERAASYFAPLARRIRVIPREELADLLEEALEQRRIAEDEIADALDTDVVARGRSRDTGEATIIVAEVSATVFPDDVDRAIRRAGLIGRALGVEAIAAVAGQRLRPEAEVVAREGVWRVLNGRCYPPGTEAPAEEGTT